MLARTLAATLGALLLVSSAPAAVQTGAATGDTQALVEQERFDSVMVEIDGEPLFLVRGVSAFPATRRAAGIAERIEIVAGDLRFDPAKLAIVQADGFTATLRRTAMKLRNIAIAGFSFAAARKAGGEAKELADLYFFETLVRVHRAGEGAAYTGLKPAGRWSPPSPPPTGQSRPASCSRSASSWPIAWRRARTLTSTR
jgi:hypothetical protein